MRITSKGQVTIPAEIREQAGLLPHTRTEFQFDGKVVRIIRAKAGKADARGARLVAYSRGRRDVAMSTDAIMALTRDDCVTAALVDANVLLDVMTEGAHWLAWSARVIERLADRYRPVINPVVYAEVSVRHSSGIASRRKLSTTRADYGDATLPPLRLQSNGMCRPNM